MAALSGIFVPNIVPYDGQGRINGDELRRITLTATGDGSAALRVHVRASTDGIVFDATDLMTFDCHGRKRVELMRRATFIKVLTENLDGKLSCRNIQVTALLEGE